MSIFCCYDELNCLWAVLQMLGKGRKGTRSTNGQMDWYSCLLQPGLKCVWKDCDLHHCRFSSAGNRKGHLQLVKPSLDESNKVVCVFGGGKEVAQNSKQQRSCPWKSTVFLLFVRGKCFMPSLWDVPHSKRSNKRCTGQERWAEGKHGLQAQLSGRLSGGGEDGGRCGDWLGDCGAFLLSSSVYGCKTFNWYVWGFFVLHESYLIIWRYLKDM